MNIPSSSIPFVLELLDQVLQNFFYLESIVYHGHFDRIAADNRQYQYNKDYFVGDYVTVEHERFGLIQPRIQLVGMIESYDQNGRTLTPTFRKG